ncbi:MAG TPA: LCP family protein [Miltoncostaeaceae bacterium]|jgi:LCP family protein required for cell wall assembly|nr:LCP family protein [Miltoncostaeaceae bacterium]
MTTAPPRPPSAPPDEPPHQRARYFRVPHRHRLWPALVGWSLYAILGLVVAISVGAFIYLDDTLEQAAPNTAEAKAARAATRPVLPGEPTNILLIGSDTRPSEGDPGRSDSLIFVRMDPRRDFISMLSFPRDAYVPIPGVGMGKINEAYSYGPAKTIETVQELTGEDVNYYVIIDFTGFQKLVDEVGGVYMDVDRRYYNKHDGTEAHNYDEIDLQPGYQKLDGVDALDFVRYRHTDSDYARIARQQMFLSELKRQTKQLGNLTKPTALRRIFAENIETNLTNVPKFLSILELALTAPKDRIARVSVQGSGNMINGASVEEVSQSEIDTKVAEWKEPEFVQGNGGAKAKPVDPATIHVTVLNGSGRVLQAEDVAQALNTKKHYATSVGGNAKEFGHATSEVYYAPAFREPARKIAQLLGPGATIGALSAKEARGNQVVVVTGQDWAGTLARPPAPTKEPAASTVDTSSLVETMRAIRSQVPGLKVMAPMKVASGSSVKIVRAYKIDDKRNRQAVKIVFQTYINGGPQYWGLEMTNMKNPPILEGETGYIDSGGRRYFTYYDGKNLQRLAFTKDGTTYWISNTLTNSLTANTIQEIAKSLRPLNRAKIQKGHTDTAITVETAGSTP